MKKKLFNFFKLFPLPKINPKKIKIGFRKMTEDEEKQSKLATRGWANKPETDKLGEIVEGVLGIISDEKERIYNEPNF